MTAETDRPRAAPDAAGTALVFRAGPAYCALPLGEVIETMRPLPVRPLAGTADLVRGVCVMRGTAAPVIDVARLLGGDEADVSRFIAVRTDRGPIAFATGEVLGIRPVGGAAEAHRHPLGGAPMRLVAGVCTFRGVPMLVWRDMSVLSGEIWAATALAGPS